jgi:subtilase family serine protease
LIVTATGQNLSIQKSEKLLRLPDLRVSIRCPSTAAAGQELRKSITVHVENKGTAPAGKFAVDLVLSNDAVVPVKFAAYSPSFHDDVLLQGGREFLAGLAAGASVNLTLNGTNKIPNDTPAGTYYLAAVVDSGKAVKEMNEANNVAMCSIRITRPELPDLRVTGFAHTGSPAGQPPECRLLVTIVNFGPAAIPLGTGALLKVWVNDVLVDTIDIDSSKVEQTAYHNVHNAYDSGNPGKSRSVVGTGYIFPSSATGLTYRCRATVDATNVIVESDEGNNSFSRSESIPAH